MTNDYAALEYKINYLMGILKQVDVVFLKKKKVNSLRSPHIHE